MVRSWIRQALRASGVAILVPAAIVAAVALSVVGGRGSVGSLGQVIAGPAVPPAETATRVATPHRDEHVRGTRGLSPQSAAARTGEEPEPVATIPERRRVQQVPGRVPARVPVVQPAPAPAAPSSPPPAPPAPQPHPIHDTGTQVAETVRPLPVAGPVAADAVEAVVDLVDPSA